MSSIQPVLVGVPYIMFANNDKQSARLLGIVNGQDLITSPIKEYSTVDCAPNECLIYTQNSVYKAVGCDNQFWQDLKVLMNEEGLPL